MQKFMPTTYLIDLKVFYGIRRKFNAQKQGINNPQRAFLVQFINS
jgi:hypothetical protein